MSEQPATGPIPVNPQGPPSPSPGEDVDQTVRLKAGEPPLPAELQSNHDEPLISEPSKGTQPMVVQGAPQDTVALTPEMTPLFPDPTATLTLGHLPEIPVMAPQNQATTLLPKAPPPARPGKRSGLLLGILVGGGVVIVLAAIGFYGYQVGWFGERVPPQEIVTALPRAEVTPAIRPYLERAEAGDVTAMQMLGYFYCYGLNVTQNREEALRWYHKAADAGSVSAQKELANLEGKSAKE